jgi:hypothetical protein
MEIKSLEQIAKTMFDAHEKVAEQGCRKFNWQSIGEINRNAWIAAAKEAQAQFLEGH